MERQTGAQWHTTISHTHTHTHTHTQTHTLTSDRLGPGSVGVSPADVWVTDITSLPTVTNGRVVGRVHWMRGGGEGVGGAWVKPMESMIYCTGLCVGKGKTSYIISAKAFVYFGLKNISFVFYGFFFFFCSLFHRHEVKGVSRGTESQRWVWGHRVWPTVLQHAEQWGASRGFVARGSFGN